MVINLSKNIHAMTYRLLLTLITVPVLCLPSMPVNASELRIASYNIHTSKDNTGTFNPAQTLKVIQSLESDIIGLQEVSTELRENWQQSTLDFYAEQLQWHKAFGASVDHAHHQYGNALLSRYPIVSYRNHILYDPAPWLSAILPGLHRRTVLEAEIHVAGYPVHIFVSHLGLLPWERKKEVQKLLEIVNSIEREGLLIVMGDFNEWIEGTNILPMLEEAFPDMPKAQKTLPVFYPIAALDRIYVQPAHHLKSIKVHNNKLSRKTSDHLPLVADIKLESSE